MKNIIIVTATLFAVLKFSASSFGQTTDTTFIIKVDSATKEQLYSKAKQWMAHYYSYPVLVTKYESRLEGKILIQASSSYTMRGYEYEYKYELAIDIKDGKYRISYKDDQTQQEVTTVKNKSSKGMQLLVEGYNNSVSKLLNDIVTTLAKTDSW